MILQPQANFTIVRQIGNHTDATSYYVHAVVRNAYSDAVIATLDMEDKGGQRFKKDWQVPVDALGQGFYISIVTSVYTDSGHTTKSENYADEENTYLVQERVMQRGGGGGLTARDVRYILKDELPNYKTDLSGVTGAIGALAREINRIPKDAPVMQWDSMLSAIQMVRDAIKPQEKADFKPLLTAIANVEQAIKDKEVTRETDLSTVIDGLDDVKALVQATGEELTTSIADKQQSTADEIVSKVERIVSTIEVQIEPVTARAKPKEEARPFNIKELAL